MPRRTLIFTSAVLRPQSCDRVSDVSGRHPPTCDASVRFYYDFFSADKKMTDADLKLIKKEMDKIIRRKLPLLREEVTRYTSLQYINRAELRASQEHSEHLPCRL